MKQLNNIKVYPYHNLVIILFFLFGTSINTTYAQDSVVAKTQLSVNYFLPVNKVPYLEVNTKRKVGRKFEPVKDITISVYINEAAAANLLGKVITDVDGKGRIGFPPSFKNVWDSLNEFKFIALTDSGGKEPLSGDITVKKAILTIDTTSGDGARTVTAQLKEKNGNDWIPVKDIDMKLGIKRMLGNLSVGDKETYTSDSSGISSAEFIRDSIPGDQKGNITLVAEVDDNDTYGNLATEKTVAWGTSIKPTQNFFDQRTLWTTRFRTPLWLLFVAYSIVIGVWGTIIYIVFQIVKIKKMGKAV
jgi:hypothetical protein